ncbi:MAG: alcohol dehydrogenase catalytic domain-containing protein [Myxococcota bacterium]
MIEDGAGACGAPIADRRGAIADRRSESGEVRVRAVRCREGRVEVVDVAAPAGPGVAVRIASAGICGSDLHLVRSDVFAIGVTLGHEIAGTAEDGTPVAIEPVQPCGACAPCRGGDYQRCVRGPAMVMGTGLDGGMAERVVVPARCLVRLPAGVAPRDACLVEPLAVAVHGFAQAGLRGGMRVAVVGGGSIGLAAVAVAHAAGAKVDLVARHDRQREAGERLGATALTADARAPADAGAPGAPGEQGGYDLVVDAAGTASALAHAVALARPGATLLLLASYWEGLELPGFLLCMKEVRVVPAIMYGRRGAARDIDVAAALLADAPEIARALITHRFPLDAAVAAFDAAADRASGAIKVVLEP